MLNLPLKVEVPDTPAKFKLGLMFRESLDRDSGMLFIFEEVGYQSFHMNHTSIPLDIAFINESGIIESIKELKPYNPIPVSSEGKILYALGVNKGWFEENNVKVGDQVMEDTIKVEDANGNLAFEVIDVIKPEPLQPTKRNVYWEDLSEDITERPRQRGVIIDTYLRWRGSNFMLQMFFPELKKPTRKDVSDQIQKVYPGAKLWNYQISNYDPGEPVIHV